MKLNLDLQSFQFNPKGTSTGVIYFQFEKGAFPDNTWNDFVDVVLGWWNEGLSQLLSTREEGLYELNFMDGPYAWVIDYDGNDEEITVQCLRHEEIQFQTKLTLIEIVEMVLQPTNELLRLCAKNKWRMMIFSIWKSTSSVSKN